MAHWKYVDSCENKFQITASVEKDSDFFSLEEEIEEIIPILKWEFRGREFEKEVYRESMHTYDIFIRAVSPDGEGVRLETRFLSDFRWFLRGFVCGKGIGGE